MGGQELMALIGICRRQGVFFFTTSEASKRETIRLTRDMGFNLRIIPGKTDMDEFWTRGFSKYTMPEEYSLEVDSEFDFWMAEQILKKHENAHSS